MATRFFLQNAAAGYTPATLRGGWHISNTNASKMGDKAGASATDVITKNNATNPRDCLFRRFVSDPMAKAGDLSGTIQWIAGVNESSNSQNGYWKVYAYVTSGDSDTPRGTLYDQVFASGAGTEFTTTNTGRGEGAVAISTVACSAGDRVVVELGYRGNNTATTYTCTLRRGATGGTDLIQGATATTTNPGWVEFSDPNGLWSTAGPPTVDAGADATIGPGDTFSRTASETLNEGTAQSRSWTIQDGPTGVGSEIGTAAALSWTPTVVGAYTLRYSLTTDLGTGTDDVIVTVSSVRGQVSGGHAEDGTAITLTLPAATQVGDTVLLIACNDYYTLAALPTPTGTAVSDWGSTVWTYDGGSNQFHVKAWLGTVTTGGAATVIAGFASPSTGDEERYAQAFVLAGSWLFDEATSSAITSTTAFTSPAVTADTTGEVLAVTVWSTSPTNFTMDGALTPGTEYDALTYCTWRSGYQQLTDAGSTGTRANTSSGTQTGRAMSLLVKPAATATTYEETGGGAAEGLGSGQRTVTGSGPPPETGGAIGSGAGSGTADVVRVKAGGAAAKGAGSGPKVRVYAEAGGAITAGAGSGTADVIRVKAGGAIGSGLGVGPKSVTGAGPIVKAGGALGSGAGSGDAVHTWLKAGGAITARAGASTDLVTRVDTGGAITSAAGSGADLVWRVDTGGGTAAGLGSGPKVLTCAETGGGGAKGAGSGYRSVSQAGAIAETGGGAATGLGSGARVHTWVRTGGGAAAGQGSATRSVVTAGAIIKAGGAITARAGSGTSDVLRIAIGGGAAAGLGAGAKALVQPGAIVATGGAVATGLGSGSRAVTSASVEVKTGGAVAVDAASGYRTTTAATVWGKTGGATRAGLGSGYRTVAAAGTIPKTGAGAACGLGSGPKTHTWVKTGGSLLVGLGGGSRVRERALKHGGATGARMGSAAKVRELSGKTGAALLVGLGSGPKVRVLPRGGASTPTCLPIGQRVMTRPRAGAALLIALGSVNRDKGLRIIRPVTGQIDRTSGGRVPRGADLVAPTAHRAPTGRVPRGDGGAVTRPAGPARH